MLVLNAFKLIILLILNALNSPSCPFNFPHRHADAECSQSHHPADPECILITTHHPIKAEHMAHAVQIQHVVVQVCVLLAYAWTKGCWQMGGRG